MDIREAADYLSVSRKGLRNMLAKGMVPGGRKVPKGRLSVWEIDPIELERYRYAMSRNADAPTRFWRKVQKTETCWLWMGARRGAYKDGEGYGSFLAEIGTLRIVPAHRWSWEHANGPIPEGLHIDHLCANPPCVRPDHLEPVTPAENLRRSDERSGGHHNAVKTHCKYGHPYSGSNLRVLKGGRRDCRACERRQK